MGCGSERPIELPAVGWLSYPRGVENPFLRRLSFVTQPTFRRLAAAASAAAPDRKSLARLIQAASGVVALVLLVTTSFAAPVDPDAGNKNRGTDQNRDAMLFFESRVRPLLINRCYECHAGKNREGGL